MVAPRQGPRELAQSRSLNGTMKTLRDLADQAENSRKRAASAARSDESLGAKPGDGSRPLAGQDLAVYWREGRFPEPVASTRSIRKTRRVCNLYVSMLQRLGVEVDKVQYRTGKITGTGAGWLRM